MKNARPQRQGTSAGGHCNPIPPRLYGKAVNNFRWHWLDELPTANPLRKENPAPGGCRIMGLVWDDGSAATLTFPSYLSSQTIWCEWNPEDSETAYAFARAVLERDWGKHKC